MLEAFSFDVSLAASGEEALEDIQRADTEQPYDLVIMDWKMPVMDGYEATRKIREFEKRGQKAEDRRQRTEDRGQKTEDRGQKSDVRRQTTDDREQKTEDGSGKREGGSRNAKCGKKAESRGQNPNYKFRLPGANFYFSKLRRLSTKYGLNTIFGVSKAFFSTSIRHVNLKNYHFFNKLK
jgi:hypothetical protein